MSAPHAPGSAPGLSDDELQRYSRQLVLPEFGLRAQAGLRDASVLVIGAGALGSPVAQYLAAAGVGRLGLVDDGEVELSNLGRQVLHYTPDIGVAKAASAAAKLAFLNPEIVVEPYPARLDPDNARLLVTGHDAVVDATDRIATRLVVNDACCATGVALVEGGVLGSSGLVMTIEPGRSACYRCVFPTTPPAEAVPTCLEAGVLGPVAGIVGSWQALEVVKLLTGVGTPLTDRMLQIDAGDNAVTLVHTRRRPGCPACDA
jgi:molybdopterin-synthase adenylyltransferase